MPVEGMVHALEQIHRVLRSRGILVDLRPDRFRDSGQPRVGLPQVFCISGGREIAAGELEKTPENLMSHRAANRAVEDVLGRGLYALEAVEAFPFRYYFRSLALLEEYIRTTWRATSLGEANLETSPRRRLEVLLGQDARAQILVVDPFRLSVMRRL